MKYENGFLSYFILHTSYFPKERRSARKECVRRVTVHAANQVSILYSLTRFALGGVLPVPQKFARIVNDVWRGRLSSGREIRLRSRHGMLWSLREWFEQEGLQEGDLIQLNYYLDEQLVEIEEPLSKGA